MNFFLEPIIIDDREPAKKQYPHTFAIFYARPKHIETVKKYIDFIDKENLAYSSNLALDALIKEQQIIQDDPKNLYIIKKGLLGELHFKSERTSQPSPTCETLLKKEISNILFGQLITTGAYLISLPDEQILKIVKELSKKKCTKLNKLKNATEKALNYLINKDIKVTSATQSEREISFFVGECIKRKYIQDIKDDKKLLEISQRAFSNLKNLFKRIMSAEEHTCEDCPWKTAENEEGGYKRISHCRGCSELQCSFNLTIKTSVDLLHNTQQSRFKKFIPNPLHTKYIFPPEAPLQAFTDSSYLAKKYGLYPHDLMIIQDVAPLFNQETIFLPKTNFYKLPFCNNEHQTRVPKSPYPQYIERIKNLKRSMTTSRYYKNTEGMLIGLWLWDKIHLGIKEITTSEAIRSIFNEEWFSKTIIGVELLKKRDFLITNIDYIDETRCLQREYKRICTCIEKGKIVPVRKNKKR